MCKQLSLWSNNLIDLTGEYLGNLLLPFICKLLDFYLEHKVLLKGRTNDGPQIKHVYARRGKRVFEWGDVAKGNKGNIRGDELAGEE